MKMTNENEMSYGEMELAVVKIWTHIEHHFWVLNAYHQRLSDSNSMLNRIFREIYANYHWMKTIESGNFNMKFIQIGWAA